MFFQTEIDSENRPWTAFTTDRSHYQMQRLPMELKISPSSFSRAMTTGTKSRKSFCILGLLNNLGQ